MATIDRGTLCALSVGAHALTLARSVIQKRAVSYGILP
jgi:hypothetical protein